MAKIKYKLMATQSSSPAPDVVMIAFEGEALDFTEENPITKEVTYDPTDKRRVQMYVAGSPGSEATIKITRTISGTTNTVYERSAKTKQGMRNVVVSEYFYDI
jgi:hypothetical protein